MKFLSIVLFYCSITLNVQADNVPQSYTIFNYQSSPPYFQSRHDEGMSRIWVHRFNQWQDDIELQLVELSKPQLNEIIKDEKSYLIMWVNPDWFSHIAPSIQASDIILRDADVWLSRYENRVIYRQPSDLLGLTVGVREGYYYHGVSELLVDGSISGHVSNSHLRNLALLNKHKVDAFVMSRSVLLYWYKQGIPEGKLYISESPHDMFTRHILVSEKNRHLLPKINAFIESLKHDNQWQKQLRLWGIESLF